jgi:hypothetical protein
MDTPTYNFKTVKVFYDLYMLCAVVDNLHDGCLYLFETEAIKKEFQDLLTKESNNKSTSLDAKEMAKVSALGLLRCVGRQRGFSLLNAAVIKSCQEHSSDECVFDAKICLGGKLKIQLEDELKDSKDIDAAIKGLMIRRSDYLTLRAEVLCAEKARDAKKLAKKLAAVEHQKHMDKVEAEESSIPPPRDSMAKKVLLATVKSPYTLTKVVGAGSYKVAKVTVHGTFTVAKVTTRPFRMLGKGVVGLFKKKNIDVIDTSDLDSSDLEDATIYSDLEGCNSDTTDSLSQTPVVSVVSVPLSTSAPTEINTDEFCQLLLSELDKFDEEYIDENCTPNLRAQRKPTSTSAELELTDTDSVMCVSETSSISHLDLDEVPEDNNDNDVLAIDNLDKFFANLHNPQDSENSTDQE